jgi:hypothetical protein
MAARSLLFVTDRIGEAGGDRFPVDEKTSVEVNLAKCKQRPLLS